MRTNCTSNRSGGGVGGGVYPYLLSAQLRDQAGYENFRDGSTTNAQLIPTNFRSAEQTIINTAVTTASNTYLRGNNIVNNAESLKYRMGSWVNAERLKNLRISPSGKAMKVMTNTPSASGVHKSITIGTNKILTIFPVAGATNSTFYGIVGTIGAGGITWGTETLLTGVSCNVINHWAIAKLDTDKAVIFFSDVANSQRFSACAFSISGTSINAFGAVLQISTDVNKIMYSACYAAQDKAVVATNIATELAFCVTASTLTLTAGAGLRITTASSTTSTNINISYVEDNKLLFVAGISNNIYSSLITISTRTLTLLGENTVVIAGVTGLLTVGLLSTTRAIFTVSSVSATQLFQITIDATTAVPSIITNAVASDTYYLCGVDTTATEAYIYATAKGFYKIKISGTSLVTNNGSTVAEYLPTSADCLLQLPVGASGVGNYNVLNFSGYCCIISNNTTLVNRIYYQFVCTPKPIVKVNGVTAYTASAGAVGFNLALDTDLTDTGYLELELVNNSGAISAMMPDDLLITCT